MAVDAGIAALQLLYKLAKMIKETRDNVIFVRDKLDNTESIAKLIEINLSRIDTDHCPEDIVQGIKTRFAAAKRTARKLRLKYEPLLQVVSSLGGNSTLVKAQAAIMRKGVLGSTMAIGSVSVMLWRRVKRTESRLEMSLFEALKDCGIPVEEYEGMSIEKIIEKLKEPPKHHFHCKNFLLFPLSVISMLIVNLVLDLANPLDSLVHDATAMLAEKSEELKHMMAHKTEQLKSAVSDASHIIMDKTEQLKSVVSDASHIILDKTEQLKSAVTDASHLILDKTDRLNSIVTDTLGLPMGIIGDKSGQYAANIEGKIEGLTTNVKDNSSMLKEKSDKANSLVIDRSEQLNHMVKAETERVQSMVNEKKEEVDALVEDKSEEANALLSRHSEDLNSMISDRTAQLNSAITDKASQMKILLSEKSDQLKSAVSHTLASSLGGVGEMLGDSVLGSVVGSGLRFAGQTLMDKTGRLLDRKFGDGERPLTHLEMMEEKGYDLTRFELEFKSNEWLRTLLESVDDLNQELKSLNTDMKTFDDDDQEIGAGDELVPGTGAKLKRDRKSYVSEGMDLLVDHWFGPAPPKPERPPKLLEEEEEYGFDFEAEEQNNDPDFGRVITRRQLRKIFGKAYTKSNLQLLWRFLKRTEERMADGMDFPQLGNPNAFGISEKPMTLTWRSLDSAKGSLKRMFSRRSNTDDPQSRSDRPMTPDGGSGKWNPFSKNSGSSEALMIPDQGSGKWNPFKSTASAEPLMIPDQGSGRWNPFKSNVSTDQVMTPTTPTSSGKWPAFLSRSMRSFSVDSEGGHLPELNQIQEVEETEKEIEEGKMVPEESDSAKKRVFPDLKIITNSANDTKDLTDTPTDVKQQSDTPSNEHHSLKHFKPVVLAATAASGLQHQKSKRFGFGDSSSSLASLVSPMAGDEDDDTVSLSVFRRFLQESAKKNLGFCLCAMESCLLKVIDHKKIPSMIREAFAIVKTLLLPLIGYTGAFGLLVALEDVREYVQEDPDELLAMEAEADEESLQRRLDLVRSFATDFQESFEHGFAPDPSLMLSIAVEVSTSFVGLGPSTKKRLGLLQSILGMTSIEEDKRKIEKVDADLKAEIAVIQSLPLIEIQKEDPSIQKKETQERHSAQMEQMDFLRQEQETTREQMAIMRQEQEIALKKQEVYMEALQEELKMGFDVRSLLGFDGEVGDFWVQNFGKECHEVHEKRFYSAMIRSYAKLDDAHWKKVRLMLVDLRGMITAVHLQQLVGINGSLKLVVGKLKRTRLPRHLNAIQDENSVKHRAMKLSDKMKAIEALTTEQELLSQRFFELRGSSKMSSPSNASTMTRTQFAAASFPPNLTITMQSPKAELVADHSDVVEEKIEAVNAKKEEVMTPKVDRSPMSLGALATRVMTTPTVPPAIAIPNTKATIMKTPTTPSPSQKKLKDVVKSSKEKAENKIAISFTAAELKSIASIRGVAETASSPSSQSRSNALPAVISPTFQSPNNNNQILFKLVSDAKTVASSDVSSNDMFLSSFSSDIGNSPAERSVSFKGKDQMTHENMQNIDTNSAEERQSLALFKSTVESSLSSPEVYHPPANRPISSKERASNATGRKSPAVTPKKAMTVKSPPVIDLAKSPKSASYEERLPVIDQSSKPVDTEVQALFSVSSHSEPSSSRPTNLNRVCSDLTQEKSALTHSQAFASTVDQDRSRLSGSIDWDDTFTVAGSLSPSKRTRPKTAPKEPEYDWRVDRLKNKEAYLDKKHLSHILEEEALKKLTPTERRQAKLRLYGPMIR